jgi:hypothetical protein
MRRACLTAALAAVSLFAVGGVAQAQEPPVAPVPPAFAPPAVAPVVDVASAENFAENFVADNARRLLNQRDRRRVRVTDAVARCLQSPILATRFGCVFTLRAFVIQRNRGWDNWGHGDSRGHGRVASYKGKKHGRHFRVRRFGCLGFLRINGGPAVTPTAQVVQVECARIPREDITVDEPVVTPT